MAGALNTAEPVTIRAMCPSDRAAVREINRLALRMDEPGTFERLLGSLADARALVAQDAAGQVIGHVIFTPVLAGPPGMEVSGMGLGELAVLPSRQRRGIGAALARAGLDQLRQAGCRFVIVVGHASYYPRFGFVPGARLGLRCQWPKVPDEAFMALYLDPQAMRGVAGVARFRDIP
jgi:putative acetyltransferase